jgi:thioester reductase-like protein
VSDDRAFLVTGGTGAVGSALIPLLLAEPRTKVHVLLRAPSDEALAARLSKLREFWGDRVDAPAESNRLIAVRGDVGERHLGMSDRAYDEISGTVTNVVHSAGNVRLNQSIEAARASAVVGVQEIIRFARTCAAASGGPKVEFLSTVGVAGRRPGLIPEDAISGEFGYHNTYEQAKAEAEQLVLREIAAGLPATIHRPSMVVGDSRDGRIIHFQVFYFLARFLAGSRTRGVLPKFGTVKLDLVPADYVARAIVASSLRRDAIGRIFHLCSGPVRAAPLADLGRSLRQYLAGRGEKTYGPRYVPRGLMRMAISAAGAVVPARVRRSLDTLPFFLDYLDEAQLFANERTAAFFALEGIASPAIAQYLPVVLDYWYARESSRAT